MLARVPTGRGPCGITQAFGSIWVVNNLGTRLVRIDPATNRVVGTVPIEYGGCGVAALGGSIWVDGYSAACSTASTRGTCA